MNVAAAAAADGRGNKRDDAAAVVVFFNERLAKTLGLYQMLDPGSATVAGRNAYHVLVATVSAYVCLVSAVLFASGVCALWSGGHADHTDVGLLSVATAELYVFSCYKMLTVVRRHRQIGDCLRRVTRSDFTACGGRGKNRRRCREQSARLTDWYAAACALTVLFYVTGPLAFRDRAPPGRHRVNVLNLHALAPADAYNAHYGAWYVVESACVWMIGYFFLAYDVLLVTLCLALSYHLRAVNAAFRSLTAGHDGHDDDDDDDSHRGGGGRMLSTADNTCDFDTVELQNTSANRHRMMYDEIKSILKDHQMVLKYVDIFFSIFQIILSQIVVSSNLLIVNWFLITKKFVDGKMQADSPTLQMIFACPILSFQIYMTCYLFEFLHKQKESAIFSLYSSHWTNMDMKCKKLILLTMNMNNAHKQKLKFTQMRIVNLDLFFRTMRVCYSIVSMMLKYKSE